MPHQIDIEPGIRMVLVATSPSGFKEKRKRSFMKNDTTAIRKVGGFESPPQAKVIILEDSGLQGE